MKKLSKKILILAGLTLCPTIALFSVASNTFATRQCGSYAVSRAEYCLDAEGHECKQNGNYQACKIPIEGSMAVTCRITFITTPGQSRIGYATAHENVLAFCPSNSTIDDQTESTTDPEPESPTEPEPESPTEPGPESPTEPGPESPTDPDPNSDNSNSSFVGRTGEVCRQFLGLITWDCNVNISDQESLKAGIWTIVSNVLVDLTIIATYLILGYVIYGGYLYTLSSGDPGKVASGKKTLTNGFIGLAIVLLANIILNAIRTALGANFASNCTTGTAEGCYNMETAGSMVTGTISWVVGIAGVVAIIFLVYGGVQYMTASGDPGKAKKAKDTIMYALIGLAIVALAQIITAFVSSAIRNASQDTSFTNNTTIAKEVHEKN